MGRLLADEVSVSARQRVRVGFRFSPLIVGPRFLPLHVTTEIRKRGSLLSIDLIPVISSKNLTTSNVRLLLGENLDGIIRTVLKNEAGQDDEGDLVKFAEDVLRENRDKSYVNLFSNNCYHFAFRVWARSKTYFIEDEPSRRQ